MTVTHVPETGARKKCSRFLAPVSGTCVMVLYNSDTLFSSQLL